MDKRVYYSIKDMLAKDNGIVVPVVITTIGYPVSETLEYFDDDACSEDISIIDNIYKGSDLEESWFNYKSRLLSFLDDNNMRVIMDIMRESDEYYCDEYKLRVIVNSVDID